MKNKDLQKIKNYFAKIKAVKLVYLYGSQATNQAKSDSDIDLAILVDEKKGDSLDIQLQAMADLPSMLGKAVEVQNLLAVDVVFAHRVITEAELILARDKDEKVAYETYILRQYFDLKPFYDEFYATLAERARRGLIGELTIR